MNLSVTQSLDVNSGSGQKMKKLCVLPPHNNSTCENACNSKNLLAESTDKGQISPWRSFKEKALSNSLILKEVFDYLSTSDLINCRLVNLIWLDESTRILLNRRALRTRPGYIQKVLKKIRNATSFQLLELKKLFEKSRRFPSTHIYISLNNLEKTVPRELQGFLTKHAGKFDELTVGKIAGESEELDIDWKVFSKFIYDSLSHIETLHVEFLPSFFENENPVSTQDNHHEGHHDDRGKKKRKCQFPLVLPNLKTITFRAFLGSRDDFFLAKMIESAPNLEQVELRKFRNEYVDPSSLCGHLYAVHLYKLLKSLDRLHLIKYHIFTDSDFIRPFEFVGESMKLESISFATTFHYPAESPFNLISSILKSSKTTLKSIQNIPYHFFNGVQIPDSLVNLTEISITDFFAPVYYALEITGHAGTDCEWINIFPRTLAIRLSTTFPNLKKVTIDFKPESFQFWENSRSVSVSLKSSASLALSSLPTVTDVTITNEPPPQFSSRLERLSGLFPNVKKLKIGNVCNFPTSAEIIWKNFTKLTSLELNFDIGWCFSHGTFSMDFAFIGANGKDKNVSILNLQDLRILKLNFFDSFEITRFPENDNTHVLLSSWAGENAFRLMKHLKLHVRLNCANHPNFLSWRTALEPLRPYATIFP